MDSYSCTKEDGANLYCLRRLVTLVSLRGGQPQQEKEWCSAAAVALTIGGLSDVIVPVNQLVL